VDRWRLRTRLVTCGALAALPAAGALALAAPASDRLALTADRLTPRARAASASSPPCAPATLNASDILPGTELAVSPLPDSRDASPETQISLLGASPHAITGVSVSGSETGHHAGRLLGYSQGDGASFVPSSPFRAGETVAVHGNVRAGSDVHKFAFHFVVSHPDRSLATSTSQHYIHDLNELQHFHTRPEIEPPVLKVLQSSAAQAPGYLFAAAYNGPGPSGPEIFEPSGNLIWFEPLPEGIEATDLQVQQLNGQPVITWWQGRIPPQGFGQGEDVIDSSSYRRIATVRAGNGLKADLHEFHITPRGTALVTVFDPIYCNLSSLHGTSNDAVTDSIFQEIDITTGLVRREWHSLDHVSLRSSYSGTYSTSAAWPFDYFHLNSIDEQPNGETLISSRNTSALYELDTSSGQVISEIGGRRSTYRLGPGATTAYQHDATALPDGEISVFDNGGVPKVHSQSRGLLLAIDPQTGTDAVAAQYELPKPLLAGSQGSIQVLEGGNVLIGWGAYPYFTEFSPSGQLLYEAYWHGSYSCYRSYRFSWVGAPSAPPSVAASASSASAPVTVYASWNGDTRTASWRVLGGSSPHALAPVAGAPRSGFETTITTPAHEAYVAVQALGGSGEVLGTSAVIASH
jgi:hypothetical protein